MKGKTIAFIKNKDFSGLLTHVFYKYIVNKLGLSIYRIIAPKITGLLSPACKPTKINGLFPELKASDITDHLPALFCEVLKSGPDLIVELGTRGGDSTKTLLKAALIMDSKMLSIDIDDCSAVINTSEYRDRWKFVQADDVSFAGEFTRWSQKNGFPASIDVLFIDTSHLYDHVVREIDAWWPLLSGKAKIIFHDTNMAKYFKTKNGNIMEGWDNTRGVIRAIEEKFGKSFDEKSPFIDLCGGWLIEHQPNSNGLTIVSHVKNG